jgi:hypothetical protein
MSNQVEVLKYEIPKQDMFSLDLPTGSKFLKMVDESGEIALFVLCDPHAKLEQRHFVFIGQGQAIDSEAEYVDSVQFYGGFGTVNGHLFEIKRILH